MSISLGVVMDPIASIKYQKDTTLALLLAAQERGWDLHYMEQGNLDLRQGEARASSRSLLVADKATGWFELGPREDIALADLDVMLMRKDPPFDNEYIYSTYILEAAEKLGTLVLNKPQSLRDCNEKVFATQFPQCCPPVLVSRNSVQLRAFHREQQDVIFKPLDGMGGSSIFRCREDDPNVGVILETLTNHGRQLIMAQRYIPEISQGDKRILVVDEGRRSAGVGEGIITALVEGGLGTTPLLRVTGADTFTPLAGAAFLVIPSENEIVIAADRLAAD